MLIQKRKVVHFDSASRKSLEQLFVLSHHTSMCNGKRRWRVTSLNEFTKLEQIEKTDNINARLVASEEKAFGMQKSISNLKVWQKGNDGVKLTEW